MAALAHAAASLAGWTAGRVAAVAARFSYALVEGVAFAFSRPAAATVVVAELAAFSAVVGPRVPLRVGLGTLLALGTLRAGQCLLASFRHSGLRGGGGLALEELSSIWEWEPPAGREGSSQSSAWHILRQVAMTANKLRAENPAIEHLLSQPALAPAELARRLYYLYYEEEPPLLSLKDVAALVATAEGRGGGSSEGQATSAVGEGSSGRVEAVPPALLHQLAHYRDLACLPYYNSTDDTLGSQLADRGFTLLCASYCADLTSGCPAYFLAISEERREVALVIRGTFSAEDAFFDLLATGDAFDPEDACPAIPSSSSSSNGEPAQQARWLTGYCHTGMGKAALFLGRKFGPLLRPLYAEGCRVTLVGHSLGAGVASLLAVYLRNRGLGADRLHCWAFETPACMDISLARPCSDIVTSLVNCDDVVPRLCVRSFAGLLQELADFDWRRAAAEQAGAEGGRALPVAQHLEQLLAWVLGRTAGSSATNGTGSSTGSEETGAALDGSSGRADNVSLSSHALASLGSAGFEEPYNAHVPGRVVLIYRTGPGSSGTSCSVDGGASSIEGCSHGMAIVDCDHPAVRRMRVSPTMISDHFIDTAEIMGVLGADGPAMDERTRLIAFLRS